MKRKEDAEERKQTEQVLQKSMERTHWTTSTSESSVDDPMTGTKGNKIKFIVEYDNSASGINSVVAGGSGVGRMKFGKCEKTIEKNEESAVVREKQPQNKIPKLK